MLKRYCAKHNYTGTADDDCCPGCFPMTAPWDDAKKAWEEVVGKAEHTSRYNLTFDTTTFHGAQLLRDIAHAKAILAKDAECRALAERLTKAEGERDQLKAELVRWSNFMETCLTEIVRTTTATDYYARSVLSAHRMDIGSAKEVPRGADNAK